MAETLYETERGIFYRDEDESDRYARERCYLDVYYPLDAVDFATVVFFHGGGMTQGERYVPSELIGQGFAVVAVDYRLSPRAKAPAYIEDAAAATAWALRNIASYGGSPGRVFVAGASAGAYLASLIVLDKAWLGAHGNDADDIAGLISQTGQMTTHFTVRAERGIPEQQIVIDELAPFTYIRPAAPPIQLVTGDRELELLGRYEENAFFLRMLRTAGHDANELHELKGHDHGMVEASAHPLLIEFVRRICG